MNEEAFVSRLRFGQSILERPGCSERDIVYHLVAPLLEAAGWAPDELYFERWVNGSAADISVIPRGESLPALTVEAKQTWNHGGCDAGWTGTYARDEKRRDDPLLQVFQQLDRIERCDGRRFAVLTDGRRFGLFSIHPERPDALVCLARVGLDEALENTAQRDLLSRLLARESYREAAGATLDRMVADALAHLAEESAGANEVPALGGAGECSGGSRLPADWADQVRSWCRELGQTAFVPALVRDNGMQEIEKLSSYHSLRFCSRLQAELPAGWRLIFSRGSGGNLNIHLFPKWTCESLAGAGNGFLFQLTPTGKNIGVIWINASAAVLGREPEGSPLWHFQRVKARMKQGLGRNPKIYQPGMVERLLEVVAEARQLVQQAALV